MKDISRVCEYSVVAAGFAVVVCRNSDNLHASLISSLAIVGLLILHHLERRFEDDNIFGRTTATCGLWCLCILPMFLSAKCYTSKFNCSAVFNTATRLSVSLTFSSVWLFTQEFKFTEIRANLRNPNIFLPVLSQSLLTISLPQGEIYNAVAVITCHVFYYFLIGWMLNGAPRSFSIGEAIFIAQGCSIFLNCAPQIIAKGPTGDEFEEVVSSVVIALSGCILFAILLALIPNLRNAICFYVTGATIAFTYIIPLLWWHLGGNPLTWFLNFLGSSVLRVVLIASAMGLSIAAFRLTSLHRTETMKFNTVVRKYFHALALVVLVPGLMYSYPYLFLASGVTFGLLGILEMVRLMAVPPFGDAIHTAFSSFVDEKDQGPLILAHIYLLIGCCLPVWLIPLSGHESGPTLTLLSGIISVGIGDSAASVFGKLWGKCYWPGTKKTVEGTLAAILFQMMAIQVFYFIGIPCPSLTVQVIAVILASGLEAFTTQVDNLVLPLFMAMLLL